MALAQLHLDAGETLPFACMCSFFFLQLLSCVVVTVACHVRCQHVHRTNNTLLLGHDSELVSRTSNLKIKRKPRKLPLRLTSARSDVSGHQVRRDSSSRNDRESRVPSPVARVCTVLRLYPCAIYLVSQYCARQRNGQQPEVVASCSQAPRC
jgi:hypothetical protein